MSPASSPPGDAMRRSTAPASTAFRDPSQLWRVPVTYGAVGGAQAGDLMAYPPSGYRPFERRIRIGHGEERWEFAWMRVMSWGIQRGAGLRVTPIEAPPEATDAAYIPVAFDDDGNPIQRATVGEAGEALYTSEGDPILRAGDSGLLRAPFWPQTFPVRVVYIIDEKDRRGAAFGTLPGHPLSGEELFVVERRPDGSVWFTVRILSRASEGWWRLATPFLRVVQAVYVRRYLTELTGPLPLLADA
ncbi:DUF1990 family protein [Salinibacterium sp. ZJ70]|uniref:DUF1990 family protein n=1 Tax=Salinibacterium sp. ZJ70 TaxID=2708084 RepID=UPI001CD5F6D2|nr:DUF1990 domain-containing protein [Salinibacterium sp. ZJ70]